MDCSTPGFPVLHYLREFAHSCPLSWWCHPTISSSFTPFYSCPQSFPASGSFQGSQLFAPGGQSTGASVSVLSMYIQDWFLLGLTGFISLCWRDSQGSSPAPQFENTILQHSASCMVQFSHPYMTTWKTIALITPIFVGKVMHSNWHIECRTLTTSFFRILNSSAWIKSPSPALQ